MSNLSRHRRDLAFAVLTPWIFTALAFFFYGVEAVLITGVIWLMASPIFMYMTNVMSYSDGRMDNWKED